MARRPRRRGRCRSVRRQTQALTTPMEVLSDDGRRAHCCPPAGGSHAYSAGGRCLSHPPGGTVAKCTFAYLVHHVSHPTHPWQGG